MPAASKKPAANAGHRTSDGTPPADTRSDDTMPDGGSPVEAVADGVDDVEDAPMNRAERRAKSKAGSQPPAVGKIVPARVNKNHGPRSYANRRSG